MLAARSKPRHRDEMTISDGVEPDETPVRYYASEILDDETCAACAAVDGKVYESLAAAEEDYGPGGAHGYAHCEAGSSCRGTLVGVYPEANAQLGEGPLGEPEPPYVLPEPSSVGRDHNGA